MHAASQRPVPAAAVALASAALANLRGLPYPLLIKSPSTHSFFVQPHISMKFHCRKRNPVEVSVVEACLTSIQRSQGLRTVMAPHTGPAAYDRERHEPMNKVK